MSSLDRQALAIVEEALEIEDPAARAAMLDAACGSDAALRARVEHLLAFEKSDRTLVSGGTFARPMGPLEDIPERFGPYKVVGEIARGGMGAVVKAVRDDGRFDQTVAIKLIRADLASQRARDRFAAERRILGRLSHPDIVRILDGGEADNRPWLAMDFIDGLPADEALAALQARQDARLTAFARVCEAVAHAHRHLVVHADIKPSNVLIDGQGGVHLLDFGIARLIASIDVDETSDSYPLTRSFAAPERSQGSAPTVASDVFSLGVLLLVMLGQRVPAEDALCLPGTRLPQAMLAGDLQAIAARALAEQPQDRYPDAAAVAQDVRRFLAHQPVTARDRPGWPYHARLFVRRNRRRLVIGGVAAALLLGVTGVAGVQHWRAETARAAEDARFADARDAARYLVFDLIPALEDTPGLLTQRVAAAQEAQGYLDRLARARQASDELRLETARGLLQLAMLQGGNGRPNLHQPEPAAANLARSAALAAALPGREAQVLLAQVRIEQMRLATWLQADVEEAARFEQLADAALTDIDPPDTALRRQFALAMAGLRGYQGRYADQVALARYELARLDPAARGDAAFDRALLLSYLAEALYYQGQAGDALPVYRQSLAVIEREVRSARTPYALDRLAKAEWEVGTTLLELEQYPEAIRRLAHAEELAAEVAALDPANKEGRRILSGMRTAHAQALGLSGRTDAALVVLESHRDELARLYAQEGGAQLARDLAYAHTVIGETLNAAGRRSAACSADRAARAQYQALRERGWLNPWDEETNLALVERRIAANC